ncbi:winged helix-turn-helix transcriptional regulator [Spiroplasma tabanidicola]|uniref:Helix-turn-helix transcriptional regulator n=1 Tax=Spiroplasma tabanidicola TaxID=324079 RepID=A0A6I6CAA6_9MOLU|nr:helix-turn-helix domain-containing protein [Spiroplasma tabanidicola]QGS52389.1 helix-turn-helix transcriptional regulator [Spiroplasma tabanidicola]
MEVCPVELSLKVLKNKWTIFIIRELLVSKKRFNELKKSLKGVTTKVLVETLKHLEQLNILNRNSNNEFPLKVTYSLTELGKSLKLVLDALSSWACENEEFIKFN